MKKTFFCVDAHTCGNPVRLVAGGGPLLKGHSMQERRLHFMREFDWIRQGLMFEPRGHDMMSGSILYPPVDPIMISAFFLSKPVAVCLCAGMALSERSP
jgi:4-hydroxyproline epimerase